jgi:hypothetical protein
VPVAALCVERCGDYTIKQPPQDPSGKILLHLTSEDLIRKWKIQAQRNHCADLLVDVQIYLLSNYNYITKKAIMQISHNTDFEDEDLHDRIVFRCSLVEPKEKPIYPERSRRVVVFFSFGLTPIERK